MPIAMLLVLYSSFTRIEIRKTQKSCQNKLDTHKKAKEKSHLPVCKQASKQASYYYYSKGAQLQHMLAANLINFEDSIGNCNIPE